MAVRFPVTQVIAKRHVRDLLNLLGQQPEHRTSKKVLMKELGLSGPNVTRVTNLLTPAGLVDLERVGGETGYSLSRRGAEEVGKRLLKPLAKEGVGSENQGRVLDSRQSPDRGYWRRV